MTDTSRPNPPPDDVITAEMLTAPQITKPFAFEAMCVYCPLAKRGRYESYEAIQKHVAEKHPKHAYKWPERP